MSHSSTPIPIPLSSLTLVPATQTQTDEFTRQSYPQWGTRWSFEVYNKLGEDWARTEACGGGRLVLWVLTKRDDPESLDFLCSCETFRRPATIVYPTHRHNLTPNQPSNDKTTDTPYAHGYAYGIASVFTPPQNRGKGYASHMMRLLHWVLSTPDLSHHQAEFPREVWGEPPPIPIALSPSRPVPVGDATFSVLYSDVGPRFYARCARAPVPLEDSEGWVVRGAVSTVWKVDEDEGEGEGETQVVGRFEDPERKVLTVVDDDDDDDDKTKPKGSGGWKWLDERLLKTIWPLDAQATISEMQAKANATSSSSSSSKVQVAFSPEQGVGSFMVERYKLDWKSLEPVPTYWGICKDTTQGHARSDSEELDVSAFATWTISQLQAPSKGYALAITRLRCPPHLFAELFKEILGHARRYGVIEIEVWNLADELRGIADEMGGKTSEREDHLPCIKWYGSEDTGEIDWVVNEKFCWC